jgi:hypothetical protein
MPQFILTIDLGNDAMKDTDDISRALHEIQKDLASAGTDIEHLSTTIHQIKDRNGNVVGHYEVRE